MEVHTVIENIRGSKPSQEETPTSSSLRMYREEIGIPLEETCRPYQCIVPVP